MAVTASYSEIGGTDFTIPTLEAHRVKFVFGSLSYGATSGDGATWTISGLNNCLGCLVEPASGGYLFYYDVDNTLLKAYQGAVHPSVTTAVAFSKIPSGVAMTTCTGISFWAWGYE